MDKKRVIISEAFKKKFTEQKYRYYFQLKMLCAIMGLLSFGMGITDIVEDNTVLAAAVLGFSVLCFADLALLHFCGRATILSYAVIDCAVVCLFTYFLLTGGAHGTGAYWILLLPICGMIILGKPRGVILAVLMLAASVFLLWTPLGSALLSFDYPFEFRIRFPLIYATYFLTGILLDFVKSTAYRAMQKFSTELQECAENDALTGIKNRFWFNKSFYAEYGDKRSVGGSLALLMDIDDFKKINDTHGHPAGDAVLKGVSDTIKECFSGCPNICRWGGEEFFVFVPECDRASASDICEAVRKEVEGSVYSYGCISMRATLSIGAVYIEKDDVINIKEILSEADKQLYLSKTSGKNMVNLKFREVCPAEDR